MQSRHSYPPKTLNPCAPVGSPSSPAPLPYALVPWRAPSGACNDRATSAVPHYTWQAARLAAHTSPSAAGAFHSVGAGQKEYAAWRCLAGRACICCVVCGAGSSPRVSHGFVTAPQADSWIARATAGAPRDSSVASLFSALVRHLRHKLDHCIDTQECGAPTAIVCASNPRGAVKVDMKNWLQLQLCAQAGPVVKHIFQKQTAQPAGKRAQVPEIWLVGNTTQVAYPAEEVRSVSAAPAQVQSGFISQDGRMQGPHLPASQTRARRELY